MSGYFRMYATPDGESHFEDVDFPFAETSPTVGRTPPIPSTNISFNHVRAGALLDWHHAPRRQFVVVLSGQYELEVSDGGVRTVTPGTVFLAEDLTGKGHIMRVPRDQDVCIAFIPLADETPPAPGGNISPEPSLR